MIRWTEKSDCLRVDYDHWDSLLLDLVRGAVAFFLGVFCLVTALSAMDPRKPETTFCPLFGMVVFGVFARSWLRRAAMVRPWRGWAEVDIRGGVARWGEDHLSPLPPMVPVRRFEIEEDAVGRPWLAAVLPDGTRRRVIGPWVAAERDMICRIGRDLNRYLGNPVDRVTGSGPRPDPPSNNT